MIAQQEYFMALKAELIKQGYSVYDNQLPPNNTPYPFVYLAGSWQNPRDIKVGDLGLLTQIVQVWGTANMRGTISEMCEVVLACAKAVKHTDHYSYQVRLNETEQQILDDNTTTKPLMQGYTSLRVSYSRR